MAIIKTPTGLIQVDDLSHVLTQEQYDALPEQERNTGLYYIIDGESVDEDVLGTIYTLVGVIGDTDISYIHDGTLTDIAVHLYNEKASKEAVDTLQTEVNTLKDLIGSGGGGGSEDIKIIGNTDISKIADGTLTGGIKHLEDTKAQKEDLDGLLGEIGDVAAAVDKKADLTDLQTVLGVTEENKTAIQNLEKSKVNASDLEDLSKKVTANANNITTILRTKADTTTVTELSTKVNTNVINISNLSANKANQSEVDSIATDVAKLKQQIGQGGGGGEGGNYDAIIGDTDISDIGDGTLTGAARKLADIKANKTDVNTALAGKANASDLITVNSKITDIENDIYTAQFDIETLKKNKADLTYVDGQIADLRDIIDNSSFTIIGNSDISKIADGTLTGAVALFNTSKANQTDLDATNAKVKTNTENITALESSKANQADLDKLVTEVGNKVNKTDFDALEIRVENGIEIISTKVNQEDFEKLAKMVNEYGEDIVDLNANKVDRVEFDQLITNVSNLATKTELKDAITQVNSDIEAVNTRVGLDDIRDLGETVTGALLHLETNKAEKADVDKIKTTADTAKAATETNKESIDKLSTKVDEIEANIGVKYNIGNTDISMVGDGTITGAIANVYINKADKTDLENLDKKVATNTTDIATLKTSKADQADLDATNLLVETNTKAIAKNTEAIGNIDISIAGKADQADLEALQKTHADDLKTVNDTLETTSDILFEHTTAIATKADKDTVDASIADLNTRVETNTKEIAKNTAAIATNTTNIATNTEAIGKKADKDAVDALAGDVSTLSSSISTALTNIENLDKKATANATSITNINTFIGDKTGLDPADTVLGLIQGLKTSKADTTELQTVKETADKNKTDIVAIKKEIEDIQGGIDLSIIGETDISKIADGTLTGAVAKLNDIKANKTDVDASIAGLNASIETLETDVSAIKVDIGKKANQTDLDSLKTTVEGHTTTIGNLSDNVVTLSGDLNTLETKVGSDDISALGVSVTEALLKLDETKLSSADLGDIQKAISQNTADIATNKTEIAKKANQADLENLDKKVTANETAITANAESIALKADKTVVENLDKKVTANETNIATNTADIATLKTSKANQTDLEATNKAVASNTEAIGVNAANIATNTANIAALDESKLEKADLKDLTDKVTANETNIAANTAAIALKANQTDLETTNKAISTLSADLTDAKNAIDTNTTAIATLNTNKADKTALDEVDKKVATNTADIATNKTAIETKADKTDLENTNKSVTALTTRVSANETNIATNTADIKALDESKLEKADLKDLTDKVTANETAIATNKTAIEANTTAIATKANQTDLETTNKAVAANEVAISTNKTAIETNTTAIAGLQETKLDKSEMKDITDSITANTTAIATNTADIATLKTSKANQTDLEATNKSINDLDTRVSANATAIETNKTAIATLETTKLDKSEMKDVTDSIDALDTRVTANETSIITLQTNKADKSALETTDKNVASLTTRVGQAETNITTNATDIAALQESKLEKADLKDITDRVTANETNIAANTAAIALKANQADLEATDKNVVALTTRVATAETNITTNISTIAALQESKLDKSEMKDVTDAVAKNTTAIATNKTAIEANTTAIATKANQTDLETTNKKVTANETSITTNAAAIAANVTAIEELREDKIGKEDLKNVTDSITALDTRVTANTTAIATNATAIGNKADKSALEATDKNVVALTTRVTTAETTIADNTNAIKVLQETKLEKADLKELSDGVAANTAAIATNKTAIEANTTAIATKANQTDLETTNKSVVALTTRVTTAEGDITQAKSDILDLQTNKLEKADLKEINDAIDKNVKDIATNKTAIEANTTAITLKANQTDLEATNKKVTANETAIATNTTTIAGLQTGKADKTALDATNANVTALGTRVASVEEALDTKVDNADLTALTTKVTENKTAIENLDKNKANKSDLTPITESISELDTRITANTTAITSKADKTALDTTNKKVAANETAIKTNATEIAKKANQTDLNITNANVTALGTRVSTNETNISALQQYIADLGDAVDLSIIGKTDISTIGDGTLTGAVAKINSIKADKTALDATNANVTALTTRVTTAEGNIDTAKGDISGLKTRMTAAEGKISTNETAIKTNATEIAKKANQTDLETTNTDVVNLSKKVAANETAIATNATNIAGKADKTHAHVVKDITDFPKSMPASDVYAWAKAPTKPTYTADEVGAEAAGAADEALAASKNYTKQEITNLINGAPETLDTLRELADAITGSTDILDSISEAILKKADKTVVDALTVRVTTNETDIATLKTDKADASVIEAINKNVTALDTQVKGMDSRVTANTNAIAGKANQSDLTALTTRVTTAEGNIKTNTTAIANKADKSNLTALETTVTNLDKRVVTNTTNLTAHTGNASIHVPTLEAVNNARYLGNDGKWRTITPSYIGLGNVDNTSDSDKIVKLAKGLPYGVAKADPNDATNATFTVTMEGVTSYYEGLAVIVKFEKTPASASSININNLGAAQFRYRDNGVGIYFTVNTMYEFVYDGEKFSAIHSYDGNSLLQITANTNSEYPLLAARVSTAELPTGSNTASVYGSSSSKITMNPSTGVLTATTFKGALTGNASTATKLQTARTITLSGDATGSTTFDGSGNVTISVSLAGGSLSGYLPLTGGTLTGNITYNMYGSSQIPLKVYGGNENGQGISVGGGGSAIVGAGESAKAFESIVDATAESLYLTSDGIIFFYTNCDTIGNRVGVLLDQNRYFYPNVNDTGYIGVAAHHWHGAYINTVYGALAGNASTATKLQTARTISLAGAVTGSTSFDGSGNITINTTIGSHTHSEYLPLSGGVMTGTIKSTVLTDTGIAGNQGKAIIVSDVVGYVMLASMKIDDGVFNIGTWSQIGSFLLNYTDNKTIEEGQNVMTHRVTLLDKTGASKFPGTVTAPTFAGNLTGNASTATKLQTARTIALSGGVTGSASFDGSANVTITTTLGSHTHAQYLPLAGGTMTGEIRSTNANALRLMNGEYAAFLRNSGDDFYILLTNKGQASGNYNALRPFTINFATGGVTIGTSLIIQGPTNFNGSVTAATFTGNLTGNAVTATKLQTPRTINITGGVNGSAKFDGSGDVTITTTLGSHTHSEYLPLAGGTMTGNITYDMYGVSEIPFKVYGGDGYGMGISVGAGGSTIIGGGESAKAFESFIGADGESLYLTSDSSIGFYTNCDVIGNRVGVILDANGYFYPNVNSTGYLGTSINKWNGAYINHIYGALEGNAATATKLQTARTIALSGGVTGSASFDGSGNITIATTLSSHTHPYLPLTGGTVTGEVKFTNSNAFRMAATDYGVIFRSYETNFYILVTNRGDVNGNFNAIRPFTIKLDTGAVLFDTATSFSSTVTAPTFTGNLAGNASTATKLQTARTIALTGDATGSTTFDGSGNVSINVSLAGGSLSNYLPLAGGTMTGNITYNMYGFSAIPFKVYGGNETGQGISIGAGGATIVGAGECAKAFESLVNAASEDLFLAADTNIQFYTNCQEIGNRASVALDINRAFYPNINNTGSIGIANRQWATAYISTVTGNLAGNAATATKLQTARTIALSGSVTGSASFDGSGNITITTTTNHTHSYLPLAGGTLTGLLTAGKGISIPVVAGSWKSGMAQTQLLTFTGTGTPDAYYPMIKYIHSNGDVTNIGSLGSLMGFFGYKADRTENGYDSYAYLDVAAGAFQATKFVGPLTGNATTASKLQTARTIALSGAVTGSANFDGSANITISTTIGSHTHSEYLPLAGGTMTGNIAMNAYGSTQYPFKVYGGNEYGQGISIGAGGATIIGAGESATAMESIVTAASEVLYITSDTYIEFYTNCQEIGNRVTVRLDESRNFYPLTTGVGSIGTNTYKWGSVYANNLHGALTGNASTASKLQTARTITLTGGITGSASFDGSANISIATTIGTHTHSQYLPLAGGVMTGSITLSGLIAKSLQVKTDLNTLADGIYTTYTDGNTQTNIDNRPTDNGFAFFTFTTYNGGETSIRKAQLAINAANGDIATRKYYGDPAHDGIGTWNRFLNSANYNTYTPTLAGTGATGTWKISVTGNAATATKLQTARTITLAGGATGSASFDGSGNITINTTVNAGSHTHSQYLPLSGGTMTGNIVFTANNSGLAWARETDGAGIYLSAESDATDNYLVFDVNDDENVNFKWVKNVGGAYTTLGTWKREGIRLGVGSFIGSLSGNASTATKLQTPRTITLTGHATGSATFDGSGNISINVSLAGGSLSGYLPLTGGTMRGTITSSVSTETYLEGNQGRAIINATSTGYVMLAKMNSANGVYTIGSYASDGFLLNYTSNATITAGTNSPTYTARLLRENGTSQFPGTVTAPTFSGSLAGNAATATKLQTARTISITGGITGSATFDGSANITINASIGTHTHNYAGSASPGGAANSANYINILHENEIRFNKPAWTTAKALHFGWAWGTSGDTAALITEYVFGNGNKVPANVRAAAFIGSLSGNATTASKLLTARTITLTGGVSGSATFDGSANITINTTAASHSHPQYLPLAGGTMTGELKINKTANQMRFIYAENNPAVIFHSNSMDFHILLTGAANASTAGHTLYPLHIRKETGAVTMNHGLTVGGAGLIVNGAATMNGAVNHIASTWNDYGATVRIGERGDAGHLGIIGKNGATGIRFYKYTSSLQTGAPADSGLLAWDGTQFYTDKTLKVPTLKITDGVSLTYDTTNKCLNFNFA